MQSGRAEVASYGADKQAIIKPLESSVPAPWSLVVAAASVLVVLPLLLICAYLLRLWFE